MRGLLMAMVCTVFVLGCCGPAWAEDAGGKAWGGGAVEVKATAEVVPAAATLAPEGRLGIIERRKLGLTPRNLLPIVRTLVAEGKIAADEPDLAAVVVLAELQKQNPKAWSEEVASWPAEVRAVNWDAILAFLEKMIPLILQLISLFG